ncbi:hypothetical protein [Streptomyces sp. NPDC018031]|uniref:hypothetical protein n=1 Tax=Streptomyces sp. NPDC018031 TaxID=3365033 RepID=UPI0037A2D570
MTRSTPSRKLLALPVSAALLVSACESSEGDDKPEKPKRNVLLSPLSRACDGIFDQATVTEFRQKHGITKVDVIRDDTPFFQTGGDALDLSMNPEDAYTQPCVFNDAEGVRRLLEMEFTWGPDTFPEKELKAGKSVTWSTARDAQRSSVELLVDCRRPDLARQSKVKKPLALTGTLTDHLGLTDATRKRILTAGTEEILLNMHCDNKVSVHDAAKR